MKTVFTLVGVRLKETIQVVRGNLFISIDNQMNALYFIFNVANSNYYIGVAVIA